MTRTVALVGVVTLLSLGAVGETPWSDTADAQAATTVLSDTFTRSVNGGWGTADVGGAYTGSSDSAVTVNGSQGSLRLDATATRSTVSGAAPLADLDLTVSLGVSALPASGPLFMGPMVRRAPDGSHVLPRIKVLSDGRVQLQLRQVSSTKVLTSFGTDVELSTKYAPGDRVLLRVQAEGTTYRAKAWEKGTTEPAAWSITAATSTGPTTGSLGFWAYSGTGNAPLTVTVDDLNVLSLSSTANQPPTSSFTRSISGLTVGVDASASSDPDGSITSYQWDFGNGTTGSGRVATVTYSTAGTYSIRLTVKDSAGATHSSVATATVAASGKPTAATTGVPEGTILTRHDGDLNITTDGTVVENKDIYGFVQIRAKNVVIRNSIIRGGAPPTSGTAALLGILNSNATNFRVENVTIAPATPSVRFDGVMVNKPGVFSRINLSGTVDGMKIYGPDITVQDSYLHSFRHYASDPNQGGKASHDDAIQVMAGNNIKILRNNLSGAYNAAVQVTQDLGLTDNLWINNNWIDGGGCSLNYKNNFDPQTGMQANNNRFGRSQRVSGCAIVHNAAYSGLVPTGNVWDDTGLPAGIVRGQ